MEELLKHILENILPDKDVVVETSMEDNRYVFVVKAPKDKMGLVIGKNGNTIRAIRSLLRVKATLTKEIFDLSVVEA